MSAMELCLGTRQILDSTLKNSNDMEEEHDVIVIEYQVCNNHKYY